MTSMDMNALSFVDANRANDIRVTVFRADGASTMSLEEFFGTYNADDVFNMDVYMESYYRQWAEDMKNEGLM